MVAMATRDPQGRYLKGSSGGPGRPAASVEESYLAAFRKACSPVEVEAITRKLVAMAKKGNTKAAGILFARILPERLIVEELLRHSDDHNLRVGGQTALEFTNESFRLLAAKCKERAAMDAEQKTNQAQAAVTTEHKADDEDDQNRSRQRYEN